MQKKTTKKKRTPNSKSKQKPKKLKTFHDSNCSLLQDGANVASISDLFKNQALKKKHKQMQNTSQINFSSTINNYTSVYTVISSIHPQKPQKAKSSKNITKPSVPGQKKKPPQKAKSKSKLLTQPSKQQKKKKQTSKQQSQKQTQKLQSYELIPQSKNSLNSEIVFSAQQTKRDSEWQQKRKQQSSRIYDSLARISQQNLVNNNRLLRSTIKQEFKRKNQAATKIQKVFRGYLTRKILQKYIRQQQQKLYGLLQNYKSSDKKPAQSLQKSKSSHYEGQFFSNRTHSKQYSKQFSKQYSPKTFRDQESINLSKINPSNFRLEDSKVSSDRMHSNRFFNHNNKENEIINCEDKVISSQEFEEVEDYDDHRQNSDQNSDSERSQNEQGQQRSESGSSSSEQIIAYRHHEVIYNGAQIQQYLQSSSSDQEEQQRNKYNEKIPKIISEDQIIFQTNQQHIESRKNSLLNKEDNKIKQKMSNPISMKNMASNIILDQKDQDQEFINSNAGQEFLDQDLIKTSKVNSIHNHSQSQKASIKSSESVSPRPKKELLQSQLNQIEQPSQKTSKKQCKKVNPTKRLLNTNLHSQLQATQNNPDINREVNQQNSQHLSTIKLPVAQKYSPSNGSSKQVFMDTISYNSEFKAKNQITTANQIDKRKDFLKKKKIYYFSDDSDQVDNEKQHQAKHQKVQTPSSSRRIQPKEQSPSQIERLKNLEMQRWDEVIKMMNCQLMDMSQVPGKSKEFQVFIKQVMQLSLKNKEILKQMVSQQNSFANSRTFKNSRIDQMLEEKQFSQNQEKQKKWKDLKQTLSNGRRKSITEQDIAIFKPNSRVILSNKHAQKQPLVNNFVSSPKSKPSFFMQPKQQLKQKINKLQQQNYNLSDSQTKQFTLMNIQNDQIDQMLRIREEMLEKRQCQQLTKLNEKLIKKELTQKDFLQQLKELTDTFQLEKISIDKAREDISKGYNAAVKLIKQAFCDAKKIGYKLPLSRSSDSYKLNKHLGFGVLSGLNNVIIDELNSKDQQFVMKHVKEHRHQQNQPQNKKIQNQNANQPKTYKIQRLIDLQTQYIGSKQFTRSHPLQANVSIANVSNNFSQSSGSIINNLTESQNSFKDHYFDPQTSPKHQSILQTPQSSMKSNIFTGNEHEFDDMSEQSSQIEFSEEQLRRFHKAQPYDPSIADMNRNVMIGKEFFEMQKFSNEHQSNTDNDKTSNEQEQQHLRMRLYREVYEIEQNSIDSMGQEFYPTKPKDPKMDLIAQKELEFLVFQIASELLMKPLFSQKFLQSKRQQMFGIKKVSDDCRKDFIKLVENMMPDKQQLFTKINQNISPLPKQLLKCMRIDFSQDDEEDNDEEYEQIGKYEMILDQDLCNLAIDKYHEKLAEQKQNKLQIQLLTGEDLQTLKQQFSDLWPEPWQDKVFAYLEQRQKFVSNRKQHCESIRWQFINMQLHCLFDAWNEQIIELKNNHNGFSGIGLNQLSLSMIDRNRKVKERDVGQIVQLSKFKLMKVLNYESQIIQEINKQVCTEVDIGGSHISTKSLKDKVQESWQKYSWVYTPNKDVEEQLDTEEESKWVYYADEALSYGLELVYLIEQELFSELAKDLRKFTIKGQFV